MTQPGLQVFTDPMQGRSLVLTAEMQIPGHPKVFWRSHWPDIIKFNLPALLEAAGLCMTFLREQKFLWEIYLTRRSSGGTSVYGNL